MRKFRRNKMKDILQISFSVKVKAAAVAKELVVPLTKVIKKALPYAERIAAAATKDFEKSVETK